MTGAGGHWPKPGGWGWIGVAVYVTTFDLLAPETMSSAFARSLKHPLRRWPTTLSWVVLSAHLFCLIPERYDPLRKIARKVRSPHA